jgi:hypothetical protein
MLPPDHPRTTRPTRTPPQLHLDLINISNAHYDASAGHASDALGQQYFFTDWTG